MDGWGKYIALAVVTLIFVAIFVYVRQEYIISYIKSGSMEPTYCRGDIVILKKVPPEDIDVGDVIVFRHPRGGDELILHRVVYKEERDGKIYFITKGDNNPNIDNWLWVSENYVLGKLVGRIPYLGYFFLYLDEPGARLMFIMIVFLVFLIYWNLGGVQEKRIYPLNTFIRASVLRVVIILVLATFLLWVSVRSAGRSIDVGVDVVRPIDCYNLGDRTYIIVRLRIRSYCSPYISISRIEINVTLNKKLVGYGVWSILYPFHGEKNVSIAIVLNSSLSIEYIGGRIVLYMKVIIKNYITGDTETCELQPETLRVVLQEE